jgi:hypothetical protein
MIGHIIAKLAKSLWIVKPHPTITTYPNEKSVHIYFYRDASYTWRGESVHAGGQLNHNTSYGSISHIVQSIVEVIFR